MEISKTNKPNWAIALGIPFLIFLSCFLVTVSSRFKLNNELLSNAILLDLLVVAPLVYFLAIRKSHISKLTVLRIFMAGILFGSFILNSNTNHFLKVLKVWIAPTVEVVVILIISRRFYVANSIAKNQDKKIDFLRHCRNVMIQITGNKKIGNLLATEIAVIYYAFWSKNDRSVDYQTIFSSYKENGLPIVLMSILAIFLVETTGMHFIFSLWNTTIAWVLSALSFYTCIQLFAHIRALRARPIIINSTSFEIHNGLAGDAYINFENIEDIEMTTQKPIFRESLKIALLKGFENHNIVVYLKKPIEVTRIFGIIKQTNTILFFVDRPNQFISNIRTRLHDNSC